MTLESFYRFCEFLNLKIEIFFSLYLKSKIEEKIKLVAPLRSAI